MPKRYEEEINEILHKFDDWPPPDNRARRPRQEPPRNTGGQTAFGQFFDHVGPQQVMALGLVLILAGAALRYLSHGVNGQLGVYAVLIGFLVLLGGYIMAVVRGAGGAGHLGPGQKLWRGQVIDLRPSNRGVGYWFWRMRTNLRRRP